ncbi:MAG TPA: GlsB/YeaQ/YmgE family stress response membrane protein [Xanthobacteraceae bacterium]|nr:GlsB/YeaQ/YmgE family stress response membrane protein [Xanthobacteraceae bacterium]
MGILIWIVIGLIAGWLANQILGGREGGLLYNLAVGLVGAVVGGLIFNSLNIFPAGFIGALVSATIGAIVFLLIWRAIRRA